jgi:Domain of unknown function (DUF4192)
MTGLVTLRAHGLTVAAVSVGSMTTQRGDFDLNRPGALIAALPAVLGFVPENSLVLVSLDDGALGSVLRVDLSEELIDCVGHLAEVAAAAGPEAAIAVIVDADGAHCPQCNGEHRQLSAVLSEALSQHDIVLWAVHVVDRVALGGHWHCVDGCGSAGAVDDPSASPLAAAAVLDGRRLYPRRADLQAFIAVDERAQRAELAIAVTQQAAAREVAQGADPAGCSRRDVENAMAAAAGVAGGNSLSDGELAELGSALADAQVRDIPVCACGRRECRRSRVTVGGSGTRPTVAVARRGAGVARVQRLCPRRRAACWGVAGGGAAVRSGPSDGGHAGHGIAVWFTTRADP